MAGNGKKRAERDGLDRLGRSELHHAASERDVERLRSILATGADARIADDNGWTALHLACQSGCVEAVRLLLTAGAVVDSVNEYGNSALHIAVFNSRGAGEIIGLLRAAGADVHLKSASGVSPLGLARTIANFDVRQFFADIADPE